MARKRKRSDHAELPTAKRKKPSKTIVIQFIGHFDRVHQARYPDVLMKMISGESKILPAAKSPIAAMKGVSAWKGTTMKTVAKEITEELGKEVVQGVAKELAEALGKEMGKEIVKELAKETTEALATKVAKEMAETSAAK